MTKDIPPPELGTRMTRIYKAVVESGHNGITATNLLVHMYEFGQRPARSAPGQLRTVICGMNKILAERNQKIESRPYGRYRLKERLWRKD